MLSLNVRGLRSHEKRGNIFKWCNDQRADIYFFQETYSTEEIEQIWKKQARGKFFFPHGTNHSRGVMTFINGTLDYEVKHEVTDKDGRFIILDVLIQNSSFLLVNVYAPNKLSEFYKSLKEKIASFENCEIVLGGDLNIMLDPDFNGSGGNLDINKNSIKELEELMVENELCDIWRLRNPNKKRFTWKQSKPIIQRRLDYWLISDHLQEDIEVVDILSSIKTDHKAIIIVLNSIPNNKFGPSFWKLNNSLLQDKDYVDMITKNIPLWLADVKYTTDPRVTWDWIKYKIRQESIAFSKAKARVRRKKLNY